MRKLEHQFARLNQLHCGFWCQTFVGNSAARMAPVRPQLVLLGDQMKSALCGQTLDAYFAKHLFSKRPNWFAANAHL